VPDDLAARFRPLHEASTEAFNRGDLDEALGGLPDDFEWHSYDTDLETTSAHGSDELKRYFGKYREVFDEWRSDPVSYEQVADQAVLVHHIITGTSRGAGVPVREEVYELWEFEADVPRRAQQFGTRDEALSAAAQLDR
jgi:SnoaL-like protein